jgi:hypothetical protein
VKIFIGFNGMNIWSGFVKFGVKEIGHKHVRIMYELLFVCIHLIDNALCETLRLCRSDLA